MTPPPPDLLDKEALIAALMARIVSLAAENAKLAVLVAALQAKLGLPPKGPANSSVPPSRGQKPSEPSKAKSKAKPHGGAHRALHPNPTTKRDVFAAPRGCGADVSGVAQEPRVTLHGRLCPCRERRFKATPPEGLEPGSPFGPNLRAFVFYLRSVQGIPLARLTDVLRDLLGLE